MVLISPLVSHSAELEFPQRSPYKISIFTDADALAATTPLSSKGQVVIPEEIRERLGLKAGAQFVVLGEKDVVIFKVLQPPAARELPSLVKHARQVAKRNGMRRSDLTKAISGHAAPSELAHARPGAFLTAWQRQRFMLVLSPIMLAEYHRAGAALASRYPKVEAALDPILALITQTATIVNAPALPTVISADPMVHLPYRIQIVAPYISG